jgi:hypothetical protein
VENVESTGISVHIHTPAMLHGFIQRTVTVPL